MYPIRASVSGSVSVSKHERERDYERERELAYVCVSVTVHGLPPPSSGSWGRDFPDRRRALMYVRCLPSILIRR